MPLSRSSSSVTPASRVVPASQNTGAFFNVASDLSKLTWEHAVNNKALLASALKSSAMMLEADVILVDGEPKMGHPPQNKSDLSLQEFVTAVSEHNQNQDGTSKHKGIKLDFKTTDVFEQALDQTLHALCKEVPPFPLWLNADVLHGPVNASTEPVDVTRFLTKAKEVCPESTLSLGFTTRWGEGVGDEAAQKEVPDAAVRYSKSNLNEMIAAVTGNNVTQQITYAVRAAFVANSIDLLTDLLDQTGASSTLTVWSSDTTDLVDAKKLREAINTIGVARVYVDVGAGLAKRMGSGSAVSSASVATVALAIVTVMLMVL